ncbi:AI-2E family transporter [Pararhizobium sp. IMCC21322]|uniref:AI-2E family transporter n=1 Tax=Pararhizobium sp. IMCC21322 TaxID=3067903 RepID=UPI002742851F|nr:AI-2E family transporter [Pararhizobium sp. IMCC21322]
MKLRTHVYFWLTALAVLIVFLYLFRGILLPFVAGMGLAFCLDPLADWFERRGFSRMMATIIILVLFLIVFVLSLVIIIPLLGAQTASFIERLPGLISQLQMRLSEFNAGWLERFVGEDRTSVQQSFSELLTEGAGWLTGLLRSVWSGGQAVLDIASLFVVTPVVAFYLLYDWDRMVAKVNSWLPRDHADIIRSLARDINAALAGFVRGQGLVCVLLGAFYAIGLSLAGLNFGLLIGLLAGVLSFIPYVGSITGFLLAIGVALVQFWPDYINIALIAVIFGAGQFLEGNILQPRLVGRSVGLHPVWLMFALFAFGSLFGFVGLLVAVPLAAAVGVLVRFALKQYLQSNFYKGQDA